MKRKPSSRTTSCSTSFVSSFQDYEKRSKVFHRDLTCEFVSRARHSGGVETIWFFSMTTQLPPLVPTPPHSRINGNYQPIASSGSMESLRSHVSRGLVSLGSFNICVYTSHLLSGSMPNACMGSGAAIKIGSETVLDSQSLSWQDRSTGAC